ncbi:ribonuclease H-like domain-containing protein, partial [Tanacetum coccineum]
YEVPTGRTFIVPADKYVIPAGRVKLLFPITDFTVRERPSKTSCSSLSQKIIWDEFHFLDDEGISGLVSKPVLEWVMKNQEDKEVHAEAGISRLAITLQAIGSRARCATLQRFDDLYNKLMSIEIDIKGGSSYKSNHSTTLSHSAFVSTTSANNKMSYAKTSKQSSLYTSTSPGSNVSHFNYGNIVEDIGKLDLEELDIKWQMAMLFVRINRFEKKAGRKMKFNNRDAARFDKKKVKCYKCSQLGHFARECTGKQLESNARYSAFKLKEMEQNKPAEPKALLSVDSMVNLLGITSQLVLASRVTRLKIKFYA